MWAKFLFYFWLFLLPWQTRYFWPGSLNGGYWEYGSYSLFLTDILFVLWAGWAVGSFLRKKEKKDWLLWRRSKSDFWLLYGLAFLIVAFYASSRMTDFSDNDSLHYYYYLRFLAGISLLWLIPIISPSFKAVSAVIVSSALVQAILGLGQFFLQQTWENKWLGLALHDPAQPGTSVIEVGLERWLRAYGSFPHPNVLAGFLLAALVVLFFWYWQIYQNPKAERGEVIFVLGSYLVIFSGLIVTFSRGAWLGWLLAFTIFVWQVLKDKSQRRDGWLVLGKLAGASVLVIIFFVALWYPLFLGRAFGEGRLEKKSLSERKMYQEYALDLLFDPLIGAHPLDPFGRGLGNFTKKAAELIVGNPKISPHFFQPVHNIYLLSLVETGFLVIFFWFFLAVWFFLKIKNGPINPWAVTLAAFLLIGFFDHYLWSLPTGIWIFWMSVSFINFFQKSDY